MLNNRNVNSVFFLLNSLIIVITFSIPGTSGWYFALPLLILIAGKVYGSIVISSDFFVKTFSRGNVKGNSVALTFDDGPIPGLTTRIAEILAAHQVKATFFCIGKRVDEHPQMVKQLHEQGHLIGNHSYLHGNLFPLQSKARLRSELTKTDDAIEKATGVRPTYFRPPYGVTNPNLAAAIQSGGYITAGWSIRSMDSMIKDETKLFNKITRKIQAGDIILFHDYSETTIHVLPRILEYIAKTGLKVVRIDELITDFEFLIPNSKSEIQNPK